MDILFSTDFSARYPSIFFFFFNFCKSLIDLGASLVAQMVKNLPANTGNSG